MNRDRLLQPAPVALLSLGIVAALLLVDVMQLTRLSQVQGYADRTAAVSIALEKTLTTLFVEETTSRGFVLTSDATYLESFEQAEREVPQMFATLRRLTSDSPLQLRRIAELERLSTGKSAFLRETVQLVTAGCTAAAIAAVQEGTGKRLMDQMRGVASAMDGDEARVLTSRIASAQSSYRRSTVVLVVAGIALLGLAAILFAIDRDIQQRRSLEQSLRGAVRAREQMLAIVSHDLRNPLSVVMMAAKLIERCAAPDPTGERLQRYANAIIHEAERMNRLVVDLLDMSKIEAGRSLHVELGRRDGAELLRRSVEQLEPLARARGLTLTLEVPPGVYDLDCDGERLHQVFSNLIGNAVKFTPKGGSITARIARLEGEIVFSVSDSGIGIPKDHVSHLFDPYWQAGADRGGAGLGLAIVKAIVQAHRGRVCVETEQGAGSSFFCALPAASRDEERTGPSPGPREAQLVALSRAPTIEGPNARG
jgi:signal transduction histidine kinase